MRLPGRLSATTLGDLLGLLHRERASGVLELIEVEGPARGRAHRIHLEAGLVAAVETKLGVARVGEILKQQGFLGDEALRRLGRELTRSPARRAGEILLQDCELAPGALSAALRRQLRQRLDALFALGDAEIRFRVARPSDESKVPLSPREFLHGRPRHRDRRARGKSDAGARRPEAGRQRARAQALTLLGLDERATREAVQRAFRSLAAAVHPDRHPDVSAEQKAALLKRFAELSAAYHLLVA